MPRFLTQPIAFVAFKNASKTQDHKDDPFVSTLTRTMVVRMFEVESTFRRRRIDFLAKAHVAREQAAQQREVVGLYRL